MDIQITVRHPQIACTLPLGAVAVCHDASTCDLVLMRVCPFGQFLPANPNPDHQIHMVVLSCSLGPGESGHVTPGVVLVLEGAAPVTPLTQVVAARYCAAEN